MRPYRELIVGTLVLTLIGSAHGAGQFICAALRRKHCAPVGGQGTRGATRLLVLLGGVLLVKELVNSLLVFGQKCFEEEIRVAIASALLQDAVRRLFSYRFDFYADSQNQTGKLLTCFDKGEDALRPG